MAQPIRVYRINTGSCGGCDLLIEMAVRADRTLAWADEPATADVLLLTGPITLLARPAFMQLWNTYGGQLPLVAVGSCAVTGAPFGRGGLAELPECRAQVSLDSCPPARDAIGAAIRRALGATGS